MAEQQPARNIWQFIENSADDVGNIAALTALAAVGGTVWAGNQLIDSLRPTFGQSAGSVVIGGAVFTAVTIGGVVYFVRKRGSGDGEAVENGQPHRPPSQLLERLNSIIHGQPVTAVTRQPTTAIPAPEQDEERERPSASLDESWAKMRALSKAEHVLIVSGTGAGKTVFVTAIMDMVRKAGGRYYVLDGKPGMNWDAKWPGAERKIKDQRLFVPFLSLSRDIMEKRMRHGAARFPAAHIVLDETQQITGMYPEAVELVADLASRGREYNVHVWLMTQAGTVAQIGFDGRIPVLQENFTAVRLDKDGDQFSFSMARFVGGVTRPVGQRYPTPYLESPWDETGNLPLYDDRDEFGRSVEPVTIEPVEEVITSYSQPVTLPLQEVTAVTPELSPVTGDGGYKDDPVSDIIRGMAQGMIGSLRGDSAYDCGAGKLSTGQAAAIFMLNDAEFSQNQICDLVFGGKNGAYVTAVRQVLNGRAKF